MKEINVPITTSFPPTILQVRDISLEIQLVGLYISTLGLSAAIKQLMIQLKDSSQENLFFQLYRCFI